MIIILINLGLLNCTKNNSHFMPVEIPSQFPSMTKEFKSLQDLPYFAWWKQFRDPTLNHLIYLGLQNNADIKISFNKLEEARGLLKEIKLSWIPYLITMGGYSTNPSMGAPGAFYGIWPFYTINIAKQFLNQKGAKYNIEYYKAALQSVRLTIIGQIASTYFTLLAEQEKLMILQIISKY